eukprot:scaffold1911_cov266-Chaetoceros_neogracile.AAC.9
MISGRHRQNPYKGRWKYARKKDAKINNSYFKNGLLASQYKTIILPARNSSNVSSLKPFRQSLRFINPSKSYVMIEMQMNNPRKNSAHI